jgi:protein phosphatase
MILSSRPHLHVAARSHPGMIGKNNEDRYSVSAYEYSKDDRRPSVFAVVADGIGGHRAGEVAAELAVSYINKRVAESNGKKPLGILEEAIHDASQEISSQSAGKEDEEGMGSTCACVWVIENRLFTAYVGDSRIYLIRQNHIQRLTIDHTWVQEAFEKGIITAEQMHDHPNVHVIRRHLGGVKLPEVDFRLRIEDGETDQESVENQGFKLESGDVILLCTDGLTDLIWDDEILQAVRSNRDLKTSVDRLVTMANERGGHDNITIVLLAMPRQEEMTKKTPGIIEWLLGEE